MAEFEKMGLASADLVVERIEQIKRLLPEVASEGGIDFEKLRLVLGDEVDEGTERYAFTWPGKADAIRQSQTPSTATLRPAPEKSVNWDTTENLYIEGDNLEVLKLLQRSYHGRVKLIYIDPPYNTGHDFVYKDKFGDTIENYREQANLGGQSNADTSGRFHSDWLSMMYPRLRLARELLREDGLFCTSIDDHEYANLKRLLDEIFGEPSYVGTIVRATGQTTGQDSGGLGSSFDYVLCYSRSLDFELQGLPLTDRDLGRFDSTDDRGRYALDQMRKTGANDHRQDRPNMYFAIKTPDGEDLYPTGPTGYDSRWRFERSTYERLVGEDMIVWKKTTRHDGETWWPYVKYYAEGRTKRPSPLWTDLEGNKKAARDVRAIFGDKVFDFPKPVELMSRIIEISGAGTDDIVLDFFSGSATTADALIKSNASKGWNTHFVLVQLPEKTDGAYRNLCEIGKERIRRAGAKIAAEVEEANKQLAESRIRHSERSEESPQMQADLSSNGGDPSTSALRAYAQDDGGSSAMPSAQDDGGSNAMPSAQDGGRGEKAKPVPDIGFRVFKLDESGIERPKPGELLLDVVKPDRTDEDIIFEMMLKWGLELTLPIEKVDTAGYPCYSVAYGELICCLADGLNMQVLDAIADMKPRRVLMLDRILDDTTKLNAVQAFKRVEEKTGREVELRTV